MNATTADSMHGLERWRMRWANTGGAPIPVWPNSKMPASPAWNVKAPTLQWQELGADFRGNLGLLPGPGLACADTDNAQAEAHVKNFLGGLGVNAPRERTPSGGAHLWLAVKGVPEGFNSGLLAAGVGKGELRTRRSNVVVACSRVGRRRYHFEQGKPEDLPGLRAVAFADLRPLLGEAARAEPQRISAPPLPLLRRELPATTAHLLMALHDAERGRAVCGYASRSEGEAAAMADLILCGWELADIRAEFERWQPGHYADYSERHRQKYLRRTYANVLAALADNDERRSLVADYQTAVNAAWPGRGGSLEKLAYCGLVSFAWACGGREFYAGERDIAEACAASLSGAHGAVARLRANGLLSSGRRVNSWHATVYRVNPLPVSPTNNPVICDLCSNYAQVELWAVGALGRTAGEVYAHLTAEPQSVPALETLTGRCRRAVYNGLASLASHGLAECPQRGQWTRGAVDVEAVALKFQTAERATLRRARHERQRENWRELCATRENRARTPDNL